MLTELKQKSQITIPKEIVKELELQQGDMFDISVEDGVIYLVPVVVYPKKYADDLNFDIEDAKRNAIFSKNVTLDEVDFLKKK